MFVIKKILRNFYHKKILGLHPRLINIEKCVSMLGFPFTGWNPWVLTLREHDTDNSIDFKDTTLYRFHNLFQPKTSFDILRGLDLEIDFRPPLNTMPWGTGFNKEPELDKLNQTISWEHSRHCGPSSDELVKCQFENLIHLRKSLEKEGYLPQSYGYIEGTFLENKDGDFRFVVVQGTHRLSILSFLGVKEILVRNHRKMFPVIKESEINNWLLVKNKTISKADARLYFNSFFDLTGYETAKEYGI